MDWRAASEQQDEARWRVFLMFVAMAVLVIRTGLVARGVIAILPADNIPQAVEPPVGNQPCPTKPADIHCATLVLLCLAEAAGRLVIVNDRAVWELMNQPLQFPTQGWLLNIASLCERQALRLDTS